METDVSSFQQIRIRPKNILFGNTIQLNTRTVQRKDEFFQDKNYSIAQLLKFHLFSK